MRTALAIACILSSAALAQTQLPDGYVSPPNASQQLGLAGTPLVTTGAMQLYVDHTSGSDSNGCGASSGAAACKTISAACSKIPPHVQDSVKVNVSCDTYPEGGCALTGHLFQNGPNTSDSGAYIDIEGCWTTPALGGLPSTGVIGTATQFSGYPTWAAITDNGSGGGWTDGGLRGTWLSITSGAGTGQRLAIRDNTRNSISLAGAFQITPSANDTYAIQIPGSVIDGGLTLAPGVAFQGGFQPGATFRSGSSYSLSSPQYAAWIVSGNEGGFTSPGGASVTMTTSPIVISGFLYAGYDGGAVSVAQESAQVTVRWSYFQDLKPANTTMVQLQDVRNVLVAANYGTSTQTATTTSTTMVGINHRAAQAGLAMIGNVGDKMGAVFGADTLVNRTLLASKNQIALDAEGNSFWNMPFAAYEFDDCIGCQIYSDDLEVSTGSEPCIMIGQSISGGAIGTQSDIRIQGGYYAGCTYGIAISGGYLNVRASTGGNMQGTNTTGGIQIGNGAQVNANAGTISMTGGSGDVNLVGQGFFSWTAIAAAGSGGITGTDLLNSVSSGSSANARVAYEGGAVLAPVTWFNNAQPTAAYAMECFSDAGVSNLASNALHFSATPVICWCGQDQSGSPGGCGPRGTPTASNVTFQSTGTATAVINGCCLGPK